MTRATSRKTRRYACRELTLTWARVAIVLRQTSAVKNSLGAETSAAAPPPPAPVTSGTPETTSGGVVADGNEEDCIARNTSKAAPWDRNAAVSGKRRAVVVP